MRKQLRASERRIIITMIASVKGVLIYTIAFTVNLGA